MNFNNLNDTIFIKLILTIDKIVKKPDLDFLVNLLLFVINTRIIVEIKINIAIIL